MKCIEMQTYVKLKTVNVWWARSEREIHVLIRNALSEETENSKIDVRSFWFCTKRVDFDYVGEAYMIWAYYDESFKCSEAEWKKACISIIKRVKERLQIWDDIPVTFTLKECEKEIIRGDR